jgi:hypothetical protein
MKYLAKILGVLIMPITAIIIGSLMLAGGVIILYSKITHKDETKIEAQIERAIESNIENTINLPSGSLDGTFDFMVQPIEPNEETKDLKDNK